MNPLEILKEIFKKTRGITDPNEIARICQETVGGRKGESELVLKYEFLHPRDVRESCMVFGLECGPGWYPLIAELCAKIEHLLNNKYQEYKKDFYVAQVKEKFGTLRFYVYCAPGEILDLIGKYEKRSEKICEECGSKGKTVEIRGWYSTLCKKHIKERKKKLGI